MDARSILVYVLIIASSSGPDRVDSLVTISELLDIFSMTKDVAIALGKSWRIIDEHFHISESPPMPMESKWKLKIINGMKQINENIEKLSIQLEGAGMQTLSSMVFNLPDRLRYDNKMENIFEYFNAVEMTHRTMQYYLRDQENLERYTLEDFAKSTISHTTNSLPSIIERIHSMIVLPEQSSIAGDESLFKLQYQLSEEDTTMQCRTGESPQRLLLNLFNTIALTELKGYTTIQFSYMLLKMYRIGNFTRESELLITRMENRTQETLASMIAYAPKTSRELWKCDPNVFKKGENYVELTELLQGFIQNEVDLNEDQECWRTCADYKYSRTKTCYKDLFCSEQRHCNGDIINCQFIESDSWVCPSGKNTNRRYDYVLYESGKLLGKKRDCQTTKVDSWWRYVFWHCSYCFCFCDEQSKTSDRYISLQPSVSNIEANRVVTGLRFVKKNRVVHLQVQEGKLIAGGKIETFSTRWVPLQEFRITDPGIHENKHYHMLTWRKRAIDLDDLYAQKGSVITGVRFQMIGAHLNLAVQTTAFDIKSGKLDPPKSEWMDNLNTNRTQIKIDNKDVPIMIKHRSEPRSVSGQYLEFTHTGIAEDAAQTTVPFFDAQPLVPKRATPLDGAGLLYKAFGKSGGFIAPKIMTLDFTNFLVEATNDFHDFNEIEPQ